MHWEHAGMLDVASYAAKWQAKLAWCAANGIEVVAPDGTGGGPAGVLMWTDDRRGADAAAWLAHARSVPGVPEGDEPGAGGVGPAGAPPRRRGAKKAAAKPMPSG